LSKDPSGAEYAATVSKAADFATKNKITTIVNGHNDTVSTPADMREYSRYVADYVAYARAQKKAGKSVDGIGDW